MLQFQKPNIFSYLAETLLENENIIVINIINKTFNLFIEVIFLMSSIIKNIQLKLIIVIQPKHQF